MKLQILHASDLEAGIAAIDNAPNFAAVLGALEADAAANGYASVTISAGDNYIPSPFFNASSDRSIAEALSAAYQGLYGEPGLTGIAEGSGRVDVAILNILGFDASAIGNHEFDLGSATVASIIDSVPAATLAEIEQFGAQFPYLSANLDFSADGALSWLSTDEILPSTNYTMTPAEALAGKDTAKIAPAATIETDGELIGVVGATTQILESISSPSGTVDTTGGENDMAALAAALQPVIDDLIDGEDGTLGTADDVNKVILTSHLQQIAFEQELAMLLSGVDVILAGGSNTLLADSSDILRDGEAAAGGYPFETTNADGDPTLVVSTPGEYSYLGRLVVEFDDSGLLTNFDGGSGLVDEGVSGAYATDDDGVLAATGAASVEEAINSFGPAALVRDLVQAVSDVIVARDGNILGETDVFLEGRRELVRTEETNLGNLTADANLAEARKIDGTVAVSIKNGGGIRAQIGSIEAATGALLPTAPNPIANKEAGDISQLDIENSLRFNNALSVVTLSVQELLSVLEHAVSASGPGATPGQFPQIGGLTFSFDADAAAGSRVRSVALVDEAGVETEMVADGAVVADAPDVIRTVTLSFLVDGGDGYDFDSAGDGLDRVDLADEAAVLGDGVATFAPAGTEQDALAEFLMAAYPDDGDLTPDFSAAETPASEDTRIEQLALGGGGGDGAPTPTGELGGVRQVRRFDSSAGETGTEIVAYEDGRLYSTNGALSRIDIWELATGKSAGSIDLSSLPGFDGVQSVAVGKGTIAVAIATPDRERTVLGETVTTARNGYVALFDADSFDLIDRVRVGVLPDMLTFTDDGRHILVANEGEFNSEGELDRDAMGSVSIIGLGDLVNITSRTVKFTAFDGFEDLAREQGIRLAPGRSLLRGLEPEYIAVSPDGRKAFVTLQEANTVAVLDLQKQRFTDLLPLGTVDHSLAGNELDPEDDGAINIATHDVRGLRMPDAIASFATGGTTYFITANEGDGRGDAGDMPDGDEARVKDILAGDVPGLAIDPSVDTTGLERLVVSTIDGDTDGDGDLDQLHSFGSRSFTLFDGDGNVVFDSGSQFERIIAQLAPERFNDDEGGTDENRSDAKGPEPEAVAVGEIDGRIYAFIGLERDSGVMIYNVTDPANASFVDYISGFDFGNISPESITFIPGAETESGRPAIAVAHEISGTIAVYEFGQGSVPEPEPELLISDVQGDGEASTYEGEVVTLSGIVTRTFQAGDQIGGFFLQEEDADSDGNAATSEGIFVLTSTPVAKGDAVTVRGEVAEFYGKTEINEVENVTVAISGNALPTATEMPVDADTGYESYEGMLVTAVNPNDTLKVTEVFDLGRFGQIEVAPEVNRQSTQVLDPQTESRETIQAWEAANFANRLIVDDGSNAQNRDVKVLVPDGAGGSYDVGDDAGPTLRIGAEFDGITGVLDYGFGAFRLQSDGPLAPVGHTNDRPAAPDVGGKLKVASLNALNFFTTLDDGSLSPNGLEPRGANNAEEFDRQLEKLVATIGALDADVIGLQELENNGFGENSAIDTLVDALNDEAGQDAFAFVNFSDAAGNAEGYIGTDAITQGIIYRTGPLKEVGHAVLSYSEEAAAETFSAAEVLNAVVEPADRLEDFDRNRPSVAASFEDACGEVFTVTVNHLKSKGDSGLAELAGAARDYLDGGGTGIEQSDLDALLADPNFDQGDGQGFWNATRAEAAQQQIDWLAGDPTGTGDDDVVVLGDLNSYGQEAAPKTFRDAGFTHTLGGDQDDYSYTFYGQQGALDHVLVSPSMAKQMTGAAYWPINADEPPFLDYNTDFEDPAFFDGDSPFRSADHDPAIAGLSLGDILFA